VPWAIRCGALLLLLLSLDTVFAQSRIVEVHGTTRADQPLSFIAPYAFYNEQFELGIGGVYGVSGYPQPQASWVLSVIGSSNASWAFFLVGRDYQLPVVQRLFLDPWFSASAPRDIRAYRDGNPDFPHEQAGSNDSDADNFIEGDGSDVFADFAFKYLLPLGHGQTTVINTYEVDRGLLVAGATGGGWWNPLKRGRTYLEVEPFYRRQNIDSGDVQQDTQKTNGMTFALVYDNTDFVPNPSQGSYQRFAISRDWGLFDSTNAWTVVEGEYSHYVSLGSTARLRQQVLAFNFWTADTLTWQERTTASGRTVFDRPPSFAGATLGGLFRMRGFEAARFNDRTVIYYALEYRVIPAWNPFAEKALFKRIRIDWLQGVLFAEAGRVADQWSLSKLHREMKWDVGLGIRAYVNHIVVRIDIAGSAEGFGVQMLVAQAF
jgi:hypothetical protein